ncbi:MAG: group 1 glycosyl transferase [Verrucomicrobia bacterium]|nr:MAG: group 1 glycosyl transferase [Verrucomicrobiota bacterium]
MDVKGQGEMRLGIWFPAVRCGSGTDQFTMRLCTALRERGMRAAISWIPHRGEYIPWLVARPRPPEWAGVAHVNTWLPRLLFPEELPVVATIHSCVHDPALSPYKTRAQALYHRLWILPNEAAVMKRARILVAVSRYTAERVRAAFGVADIRVIYNGVDCRRFAPAPRTGPHRPFRLLYVGNWSPLKGVEFLGPVMERLGGAFELAYTRDRCGRHARYRLPGNCRDLGRLGGDDLVRAYQEADTLFLPSHLEGLPLTVLEAMACGLPVIAAQVASLPEVVEHGVTGLLCRHSVEEFAEACRDVADPSVWRSMREGARERVEQLFAESDMVERYISLYEELCS